MLWFPQFPIWPGGLRWYFAVDWYAIVTGIRTVPPIGSNLFKALHGQISCTITEQHDSVFWNWKTSLTLHNNPYAIFNPQALSHHQIIKGTIKEPLSDQKTHIYIKHKIKWSSWPIRTFSSSNHSSPVHLPFRFSSFFPAQLKSDSSVNHKPFATLHKPDLHFFYILSSFGGFFDLTSSFCCFQNLSIALSISLASVSFF